MIARHADQPHNACAGPLGRAIGYAAAGRWAEAASDWQSFFNWSPRNGNVPNLRMQRGTALYNAGQFEAAIADFSVIIKNTIPHDAVSEKAGADDAASRRLALLNRALASDCAAKKCIDAKPRADTAAMPFLRAAIEDLQSVVASNPVIAGAPDPDNNSTKVAQAMLLKGPPPPILFFAHNNSLSLSLSLSLGVVVQARLAAVQKAATAAPQTADALGATVDAAINAEDIKVATARTAIKAAIVRTDSPTAAKDATEDIRAVTVQNAARSAAEEVVDVRKECPPKELVTGVASVVSLQSNGAASATTVNDMIDQVMRPHIIQFDKMLEEGIAKIRAMRDARIVALRRQVQSEL